MKIKAVVIFLLIAVGLVYGGSKSYVYIKVKRQANSLVTAVAPFVNIQYGSISSTLDGVIHIDNIAANPHGIDDTVNVERLSIKTPGLIFLIQGSESIERGELPDHIGISLRGVNLRIGGPLARMLEEAEAKQTGVKSTAADACTLSRAFIFAQYRELGMNEVEIDIDYVIERGAAPTEMQMTMNYSLHGIEKVDFAITLKGIGDSIYSVAKAKPLLKNMNMSYKPDPEFFKSKLEHCSKKKNLDILTFVDQLFEKTDEQFANEMGYIPGPGIRAALKQLYQKPGELRVNVQPSSPLDISTVHLFKQDDWSNLFGLSVLINDKEVSDLSFRIPNITEKDSANSLFNLYGFGRKSAAENQVSDKKSGDAKAVQASRKKKKGSGYRVVDPKSAPRLIGRQVRILTFEGKHRSGRILGAEEADKVITLEKRTRGGTFSMKVYVGAIEKIEVLE